MFFMNSNMPEYELPQYSYFMVIAMVGFVPHPNLRI